MQLNVQQGDSYSKSVNDKAWMTIAIVEQQHNAGLCIMPSGAKTIQVTQHFFSLNSDSFYWASWKFLDWVTKRRFFVWASVKELLAMCYDYTGKSAP